LSIFAERQKEIRSSRECHFGGAVFPDVPTAVASCRHSRRAFGGARRGLEKKAQRGLRAPSGRSFVETMTPVPGDPPRVPFTYWAQRKDRVFLTLECPNAEDPKVHLTDDGVLTFSANAKSDSTEADHHYELTLELLHPINAKDSQIHVGPRRVTMVIAKTEEVSGRRDVSSPFHKLRFGVSVFSRRLAFGGAFDASASDRSRLNRSTNRAH
jgi:hypothetical protein